MSDVFIGRQPILDGDMQLFAYELCFYQGANAGSGAIEATQALIKQLQDEVGFAAMVGNNTTLLNVPEGLITPTGLPDFGEHHAHKVVLEIPNTADKNVELLKNLKALKSLNGLKSSALGIALKEFNGSESSLKLASISEFAKIDVALHSEIQLKKMVDTLHARGIKVMAEKVDNQEHFEYLKKLGFDYFQGYFFTHPIMINGHTLSGNQLTLLQLLAKVNDPNTDFAELSSIIKQDVGLSHKLLVAINHPATQIPVKVQSVADGLKYMGLKRLKFWVNMLMLSGMEGVPAELLTSSLARAKFCELLADAAGHKGDKESYFLVGLFSTLDGFFKVPMTDILEQLPLSEALCAALVSKGGAMGQALSVLEAMESAKESMEHATYEHLNIRELATLFMAANAWAQQIISE